MRILVPNAAATTGAIVVPAVLPIVLVCVLYPFSPVVATNIRRHEGRATGIDIEQSVFWRRAEGVRARKVRHFPVRRILTHIHTRGRLRGRSRVHRYRRTYFVPFAIDRLEILVYFFGLVRSSARRTCVVVLQKIVWNVKRRQRLLRPAASFSIDVGRFSMVVFVC